MKKPSGKAALISGISIAALFAVWEAAARLRLIDTQFVPAFSTVMKESYELLITGKLLEHIGVSMGRLFMGILLAVATALPLGFLLAGWAPRLTAFIRPLFTNLSMLNPFTLISVFIILLGIGEGNKIGIIYWVILWPALFSTIAGVTRIDPQVVKAARVMGAKGMKLFFSVILPGSINRVFTGIKSAVTLGFTVLLSAEMIGSEAGLGWIIFNAQKNYNVPRMFVGIVFIAILGVLVSVLIDRLQKKIVIWEEGAGAAL
jgi:NitT/TauT family transport system permease protein